MHKITPNPPPALDEAAIRAIDHYLAPKVSAPPSPQLFTVAPHIDPETLLANASETLACANVMASDLAFELDGSRRRVALAIQQLLELGQLLVDRALDQHPTNP